jgi:hypothetical protein
VSKVMLSDLFPLRNTVSLIEGKPGIEIRPLKLPEIVSLLMKHKEGVLALYNESQSDEPNYEPALLAMPGLITDVICLGADMEDQRADVDVLPPGPQMQLLAAIWELSVPDPKKLIESLSKLTVQAKRLVQSRRETDKAALPPAQDRPSSPAAMRSSVS